MAFIVLRAAPAERVARYPNAAQEIKASIMKHVADQKVSYKRLAGGIEFLDAIPTSPSGKLLRRVLREKAKELRGGGRIPALNNNHSHVHKWPAKGTRGASI